jgi:hypothetical protein
MKKTLITTLALAALVASSYGQGFVLFSNGGRLVTVNSSPGGASTGSMPIAPTTGANFYFALYYSAAATTVNGSSAAVLPGATPLTVGSYVFSDANWTFDNPVGTTGYLGPAYATNSQAVGKFASTVMDVNNSVQTLLPFTTAAQFVVLGWSGLSNGVTPITTVGQLAGWYNSGSVMSGGYIGETIVSGAILPSLGGASPAAALFGAVGGGLLNAFTLGQISTIPEPTTLALAGLGGLSLLLFRRRK